MFAAAVVVKTFYGYSKRWSLCWSWSKATSTSHLLVAPMQMLCNLSFRQRQPSFAEITRKKTFWLAFITATDTVYSNHRRTRGRRSLQSRWIRVISAGMEATFAAFSLRWKQMLREFRKCGDKLYTGLQYTGSNKRIHRPLLSRENHGCMTDYHVSAN